LFGCVFQHIKERGFSPPRALRYLLSALAFVENIRNRDIVMKSGEADLNDDGTPKTFWQKYKKWILIAAVPAALLPIVLYFVFRKPSGGSTANPRRQAAARKARLAKMAKAKKK